MRACARGRTDLLNLTGIADAVTPANSATFSYSPANRLATAAGPWGSLSWTYDGVGNRLTEVLGAASKTYSYPVANNKLSAISGAPTRAFTYDANGNILTDVRAGVTYAYTYNNANRLRTVTVAGNLKATYTYSALEQLAIRVLTNSTPSGTIHSIYDLDGNLIVEANDLGQTVREYVWNPETEIAPTGASRGGIARPIAVVDGVNGLMPALYFVQVDHLNRPVRMTNSAKAAVWTAVWKPFGEPQSITGAASLDARFPGQWFQLESGLSYNWHRQYDASTGRYAQPDPLGFVDGPGRFGYARSTPAALVDKDVRMTLICKRKTRFNPPMSWINELANHNWIKTDELEAGMGVRPGEIPGDPGNADSPYSTRTTIIPHDGQSLEPNAICLIQNNVDEQCVNRILRELSGADTGPFAPFYNDCESLAYSIIQQCRTGPQLCDQCVRHWQ